MEEILFLAHRIPFPPDRGDKMRSWHLLRRLAQRRRVHLACFADDQADAGHLLQIRKLLGDRLGGAHVEVRGRRLLSATRGLAEGLPLSTALFDSPAMHAFVARTLGSGGIGTIFAFSGQMAQYVPDPSPCRFIMDFVDMDSAKFDDYARRSGALSSWLYRREARLLVQFERRAALRADVSLFVSNAEAALFKERAALPSATVQAVGNGIDLQFYDPEGSFARLNATEKGEGPLIVFTGQMDYRPNVEAVTAFAHDVMPLIRHRQHAARFAVVGRNPTAQVRRLEAVHGTCVTGAVADVRSWLAAADLVVAPLQVARGIQNKVLEAMAMGRAAVISSAAYRGIEAEAGRELVVADGPEAQAQAIASLLADEDKRLAIGRAARRAIETRYGWDQRLAPLDEMLGGPDRRAAA